MYLYLSQANTCISNTLYLGLLYVQLFKVRVVDIGGIVDLTV
jgi:hypothetical protein